MRFPLGSLPRMARRDGFTIVELLVVVSLIMLLIAMLLPALRHGRNEARVTTCAAQLMQINVAVRNYMSDNLMNEPWHFANGSADYPHESGSNDAQGLPGTPARALTQWSDNLPDGRLFFCPTVPIDYDKWYDPRPNSTFDKFHGTYAWHWQKIRAVDATDKRGNGILYANNATRDVVEIDAAASTWFTWGFPYDVVHYNALKIDGHVEMVGRAELDVQYYLWGEDRRPYN